MRRLSSIHYLRATAVLLVTAFHIAERAHLRTGFLAGASGVDLFFVISGFLMWTVTCHKKTSTFEFLRNRAIRIIPLYWFITLGFASLLYGFPSASAHPVPSFFDLLCSLLFIPHVFVGATAPVPLLATGWTLNYEMMFYLIFAISLPLTKNSRLAFVIFMIIFIIGLGYVGSIREAAFIQITSPISIEFIYGLLIAAIWEKGWIAKIKHGELAVLIAVAGIIVTGFFPQYTYWRFLMWGLPMSVAMVGLLSLEPELVKSQVRSLNWLADSSYSIYLTHAFTVSAVIKLLGPGDSFISKLSLIICCFFATFLVGRIFYLVLEKPLTERLRRRATTDLFNTGDFTAIC